VSCAPADHGLRPWSELWLPVEKTSWRTKVRSSVHNAEARSVWWGLVEKTLWGLQPTPQHHRWHVLQKEVIQILLVGAEIHDRSQKNVDRSYDPSYNRSGHRVKMALRSIFTHVDTTLGMSQQGPRHPNSTLVLHPPKHRCSAARRGWEPCPACCHERCRRGSIRPIT
jgi:hypothetical protein